MKHGQGLFKFASGNKEEGEYKEGKEIGIHIFIFKDGTKKKKQYPGGNWVD